MSDLPAPRDFALLLLGSGGCRPAGPRPRPASRRRRPGTQAPGADGGRGPRSGGRRLRGRAAGDRGRLRPTHRADAGGGAVMVLEEWRLAATCARVGAAPARGGGGPAAERQSAWRKPSCVGGSAGCHAPAADEARAEIDRLLPDRPTTRGATRVAAGNPRRPGARTRAYVRAALPARRPGPRSVHARRPVLRNTPLVVDARGFASRWERICGALAEHQPGGLPPGLAGRPADARPGRDCGRPGERVGHGDCRRGHPDGGRPRPRRSRAAVHAVRGADGDRGGGRPIPRQGAPGTAGVARRAGRPPSWPSSAGWTSRGSCAAVVAPRRGRWPASGARRAGRATTRRLGFLARDGEENRYRVATCDACRTGIKTLSTLSMLPPLMLVVADAATLHLDLAAAERGYAGPR